MKCPVCKYDSLSNKLLEEDLHSLHCLKCNGNWLKSFEFWKWFEENRHCEFPASDTLEVSDTHDAKPCVECSRILRKFKVGHGLDFYIERCMSCGGIWFDKNEWESIRGHGLLNNLHLIFTTGWQHEVRDQESKAKLKDTYKEKLGDDFTEVERIKEWLKDHPQKDTIYSYWKFDLE